MVAYFIRNFQRLITNEIDDSSHTTKIHTNYCNWHLLRISLSSGLTGFFLVTQTHLPNNSDSSLQLVMAAKTFAKELEHNNCLVKLARGRLDCIELILKKAFKKAYKNDLNAVNGTRASPIKEHHLVQTAFKSDKIFSLFLYYLLNHFCLQFTLTWWSPQLEQESTHFVSLTVQHFLSVRLANQFSNAR